MTSLFYHAEKGYNPQDSVTYAWIGFYSQMYESGTTRWRWTDTSPTSFTQWAAGEPNAEHISSKRSCAYLDSRLGWHVDTNCNAKINFICKSNTQEIDLSPPADDRGRLLDCADTYGEDWHATSNEPGRGYHCMKAYPKEVDWHEAEHICNSRGAHLMSIHSNGKE